MVKEYYLSGREITTTATPDFKHFVRIKLEQDEDGRWIGTCPDIQGVVTDGATERECITNLSNAITAMKEAAYNNDGMFWDRLRRRIGRNHNM